MAGRFRIAFALRTLGLCMCAIAAWAFAGLHWAAAAPAPLRALLQAPLVIAADSPAASVVPPNPDGTPEPEPAFTPTPAPKAAMRRGGPIEISLSGSMNVGSRASAIGRDASTGLVSDSQNQTEGNVGMLAQLTRRTASTTLQIGVPLDLASENSLVGVALASYATPHYEISYTSASASAFGQLPVGATLRGFALTLPMTQGDAQFFEGPAYGASGEILRVRGVRLRRKLGRSLAEFAITRNQAGMQTPQSQTELAGIATSLGRLTVIGEAAMQQNRGFGSSFSYQARADLASLDGGWSATVRHIPQRFLLYGTGEAYGDSYADLSFRKLFRGQTASADVSYDTTSLGGDVASQRRSLFTYGGQIGHVQTQVSLQEQKVFGGTTPAQWAGQAGVQLATAGRTGFALVAMQVGRTTQPLGGDIGTTAISGQITRMIGPFEVGASYQGQRQTNTITGSALAGTESFTFDRLFGRSSLGIAYNVSRAVTPYSNAVTRSPVLQLGRQISPALSVQVQYGRQSLVDAVNPQLNSHGRIFSVQLNAPFSFGGGTVQGRSDPHLPATIVGRILEDSGLNGSLAFLNSGGMGNVTVVLDNHDVQQTDLEGNFRFSFVAPGTHTVRVESSSLPRGYTVDQPIATVMVQGGQVGQVSFLVGNFGAIAGHVFGRDSSGALVPLSDVTLRIDGGIYTKTDTNGAYGFGRLLSGDHTVQILGESIPAFADFPSGALERKISVQNGSVATVDFTAEQLGSIAGRLTFAPELAPDFSGGVNNAYVVAEPGEHAAITDPDGTFLIDDLPPGNYTVSVDPETIPDPTGALEEGVPVSLQDGEHYSGLLFHIGRKKKAVVFSFVQQKSLPVEIALRDDRLPPLASTSVSVSAPKSASGVKVTAFEHTWLLHYDESRSAWTGTVAVPEAQKDGSYDVVAHWNGAQPGTAAASLNVDKEMPLAILQTIPAHASIGQYVGVRARFLVDARAGDQIEWQDGDVTTLRKPISGRIFAFSLRLSLRPLHGTLLTQTGKLPITLP